MSRHINTMYGREASTTTSSCMFLIHIPYSKENSRVHHYVFRRHVCKLNSQTPQTRVRLLIWTASCLYFSSIPFRIQMDLFSPKFPPHTKAEHHCFGQKKKKKKKKIIITKHIHTHMFKTASGGTQTKF